MKKTIFHLDLDSFYVSAERLKNPALLGRPVAVGGSGPRSVLSSCSYEARKLGVRSAMPTAQALRLCPNLILCEPDFGYYSALSNNVFSLLDSYTPVFEKVSIDEAFLDMTGTSSLFGPPKQAAEKLRSEIRTKTGLTASIGIATNRLVAKVATDFGKPDRVTEVPPGNEAAFLAPLEVSRLPGCGKVTQKWLDERGIKTIQQLQNYSIERLDRAFGKFGIYLHESAWGKGSVEFNQEPKVRSISKETTFDDDEADPRVLYQLIREMTAALAEDLREEATYAKAVRLKLRYPPFFTVTRSRVLKSPSHFDKELFEATKILFDENWTTGSPLRLLGVAFVVGEPDSQLGLFAPPKQVTQAQTVDQLRDEIKKRFGSKVLRRPY